MSVSANQMTSAQFNAASSDDYPNIVGTDRMIMGLIMQTTDKLLTPTLDDIDVSYNSNTSYLIKNDYIVDIQGTNSIAITAPSTLTSSKNIRVLVVR
jgi:hypothetical protein